MPSFAEIGINRASLPVCLVTASAVMDTLIVNCYCKWEYVKARFKTRL